MEKTNNNEVISIQISKQMLTALERKGVSKEQADLCLMQLFMAFYDEVMISGGKKVLSQFWIFD